MAENCLKIRMRRMLRSLLASCKSEDQICDVVETRQRLFSPRPHPLALFPTAEQPYFPTTKLPSPSPDLSGRKCPPHPPSFHLLTTSMKSPRRRKKPRNSYRKKGRFTSYKVYSRFEDQFPDCKYNGLFSSDDEEEGRGRSRRRNEAVEDSTAVVKRSRDPYSDFRTSMVEMIVEKQIFAAEDLENLLRCFLSLNSYHHHRIIIQVFAEILEALLL